MKKKFFVEVMVGIFLDEMDDDNSSETAAEIAESLVRGSLSIGWPDQIETYVSHAVELSRYADQNVTLNSWVNGNLF